MTSKDFSDFNISFNLNLEVDANMRKISEFVKIISAHSRECPQHLSSVNKMLAETADGLSSYINLNFVIDEEKH